MPPPILIPASPSAMQSWLRPSRPPRSTFRTSTHGRNSDISRSSRRFAAARSSVLDRNHTFWQLTLHVTLPKVNKSDILPLTCQFLHLLPSSRYRFYRL